jgi:hypothetical protein
MMSVVVTMIIAIMIITAMTMVIMVIVAITIAAIVIVAARGLTVYGKCERESCNGKNRDDSTLHGRTPDQGTSSTLYKTIREIGL